MFETEHFVYIQMQKTGCTHIAYLLSSLFGGRQVSKHNSLTAAQMDSGKYIIASIRNPWDWYLSLWTYGVQGNGALRRELTKRHFKGALKEVFRHPGNGLPELFQEMVKDIKLWQSVYENSDNVELFRKWLKLIHDPVNSRFLGEGYGTTALPGMCGIMTYRFLYLCCRSTQELKNAEIISDYDDLLRFQQKNCFVDYFIRQEQLEDDFCRTVEKARHLKPDEKDFIYSAKPSNQSRRTLSIQDYYDQETVDLVQKREKLLIEKFDYSPPGH